MKISFFVEKQSIKRTDREAPATSSLRYLKAEFSFGKDWDTSHNICPLFRLENSDVVYAPALTNGKYLDETGTCFVPIELLQNEGRFFVSVVDETNGIRITTSEAYVTVRKGSNGLASPTIHALDLAFINETTHLQLTSNGKPVGAGVEIPTTETTVWKTAEWLDKPLPIDKDLHYFEIKTEADRPNPSAKPDWFTVTVIFRFYAANRVQDPENPNRDIYIPTMRGMPKIYNKYTSETSYQTLLEPCELTLMWETISIEEQLRLIGAELKQYGIDWIPGYWVAATTPNRPTFLEWVAGVYAYDRTTVPQEVLQYFGEILQSIRELESFSLRLTRFPSEEKPAEVIQ